MICSETQRKQLMQIFKKPISAFDIITATRNAQDVIMKRDRASHALSLEDYEELAKRIRIDYILPLNPGKEQPVKLVVKTYETDSDSKEATSGDVAEVYQQKIGYHFQVDEDKELIEEITRYFIEQRWYVEGKPFLTMTMLHGIANNVIPRIIYQLQKSGYSVELKKNAEEKFVRQEYVIF